MELPFPKRFCLVCQKEFLPHHQNQTLCSDECRKTRRKTYRETYLRKGKFRDKRSMNRYLKNRRFRIKSEILKILGNKCLLCQTSKSLRFHNKSFKNHNNTSPDYILRNIKEFTVLCQRCHAGVHFLHNVFGLSWEQIIHLKDST